MIGYQYVVMRVVPRVEREEFVNVAVVLYAQAADFLDVRAHVEPARLRALAPGVDVGSVRESLAVVETVCSGREIRGQPHPQALGKRFGWISAPRSTVVQPGPVHGGLTADPEATLEALVDRLVRVT